MKAVLASVLVVDDEPQIRRFLRTSLDVHGYGVDEAQTARDAIQLFASTKPDLVVLDLGLPDADGFHVLKTLRETSRVPVVILSVRDRESEKIKAFEAGADDYLTKPFGMGELLARIQALLRRAAPGLPVDSVFRLGGLEVDL